MRARFAIVMAMTMACTAVQSASASGPLTTALVDPSEFSGAASALAFARTKAAGANAVDLLLDWSGVAPGGISQPPGFDATDPASMLYNWVGFDEQVRAAVAAGLTPIVTIFDAPAWARLFPQYGSASIPDSAALGAFARAAALRYSGTYLALPKVETWAVWNEPNISLFLAPQFQNGSPYAPAAYRQMVNAVAANVKAVAAGDLVVAGDTAPFFDNTPAVTAIDSDWGPLAFMRAFLCLDAHLQPTCSATARFDVWATHPYGSGGPTRHATLPDDVSIGDLPAMRAVLDAAMQTGHIVSPQTPSFWVTEFSWDSSPPDPNGVPEPLLSRWTSEALYRMWQSGVSLVTWFLLRDQPLDASPYQSGLWFRGPTLVTDTPKPVLQSFSFPFVAFARRHLVTVWGRTPGERPATVVVEQAFAGGWTELGRMATDANGIFQATYATAAPGAVRARTLDLNESSVPFSLALVPDQTFAPFGGDALEPAPDTARPALPSARAGTRDRIVVQKKLP